ncbi:helix-turn-helix domain-containing protein [Streptacidiphilus sp. PAMC 29251]
MAMRLPVGAYLLLDGEDASRLDSVLRRAVYDMGRRDGCVPDALVRFSEDVHKVALQFRASLLVEGTFGTVEPEFASVAGVSAVTDQLTTQQLARLAGCSDSYVRRQVNTGVLPGMRTTGGGWLIDSGAAAVWLAGRSNRTAA